MKACRVAALWQVVVVACAIAATTGLPSAARSQGPSSTFVVGTDTLDGTDIAAIRPHMQRLLTVGRPHDPIAFSSGQLTGTVVILRQGRGTDGQVCREVSLAWAKERFIAERLITYCGGTPSWQATRNALQPTLVTPYAEKLLSDLRQRAAETVEEQRQKEYLAAQQREAVSREAEQRQAELQERRDIAARTALIAAVHARLRAQSLQDAPRTDCDVLTAHPDDPLRIADPVERKDRDAERAIPACAAALATYPSSPRLQLQYALALDKAERFEEAVEWYRRAAARQYPYAIYSLGWAHMRGQGVPKNEGEGARLIREATNYQLSVAENTMGFLFENGRGVKRDPAEAARWYRLAAEQGRAVAQHNLGRLYRDGRGLEQDDVAAVRWLRRAAEQERPAAMFDLGRMLERGRGVAEDVDGAIRFYKMAALRDYQPAEQHLAKLANESEVALRAAREVAEERLSIQAARIEKQREEDARLQEQRDAEARQRREMEARALAAAEAEERRRAHVERVRSEGDPDDILVIFNTRGSDDGKGVERSLSGTLRVADSYEPCIEPALRPKLKRDEDGLGDFLDDRLLSAMGIRSRRFRDCTPTTSSASLFLVSRLGYEGCRPLPCRDLEAIAEFRMAELATWQETKRAERERRRQERLAQLEQERREREEADRIREERRSDRLRLLRSGQAEGYDTVLLEKPAAQICIEQEGEAVVWREMGRRDKAGTFAQFRDARVVGVADTEAAFQALKRRQCTLYFGRSANVTALLRGLERDRIELTISPDWVDAAAFQEVERAIPRGAPPATTPREPDTAFFQKPPLDGRSLIPSRRPVAPSPPDSVGALPPLPASELAEQLEKATALVLAENSLGTGFFVDPTHLVTNRHVVEASRDGTVVLISRALDKPLIGTILRKSLPGAVGSLDLALIAVRSGSAPGHLRLASSAPKLASVIASGYPGRVIEHDADFRALQRGDLAAAPDLNLTRGGIQSVQSNPAGVRVIVHTASVMKGNSGGPLVDECGRAIGVNTYINVDLLQAGRISYAQMSEAVVQFAKQAGVDIRLDSSVCTLRD